MPGLPRMASRTGGGSEAGEGCPHGVCPCEGCTAHEARPHEACANPFSNNERACVVVGAVPVPKGETMPGRVSALIFFVLAILWDRAPMRGGGGGYGVLAVELGSILALAFGLPAEKSGNIWRVGIFLDFVWLTTRTMHPRGGCIVRAGSQTKSD